MYGLGTIINVAAIVIGGLLGMLFGRFIGDRHRDSLCKACGLSVIFIGAAGALKGMFFVEGDKLVYGGDFLIIGCLALGALIGELIDIEGGFEKFGAWLKLKTHSTSDGNFIEGMACIGGCIGGAGCLTHGEKNKAEVDKYGREAFEKTIGDAVAVLK